MRKSTAQKRKIRSLYVKRRNKKVKATLLVGISLGLLGIFFLGKSIIAPAVSAYSSGSSDLKDKDIYSTLLVEKDDADFVKTAKILIFQKKDAKLYSINIPVDLKIDLPGRFGEEEYQKILKLAETTGEVGKSEELLIEATKKVLKINVDRYIITTKDSLDLINGAIFKKEFGLLAPWETTNLIKNSQLNFTGGELLDMVMFARGLTDRDISYIDLNQVADLGLKLRDITLSGAMARESMGVVVLNGTGKPDVAKEASPVFQNMGARISLTANAENEYEKSYLVTDDPLSATARYIKSYYPNINIVNTASASSLGEGLLDRGDICVIVGFDILAQQE